MYLKIAAYFIILLYLLDFNHFSVVLSNPNVVFKPKHQIQIKITYQEPDYRIPWRSKNPGTRFAIGTYLGRNQVLVVASLLASYTLIEGRSLEEPSSITGKLIRIDYDSDLAILEFPNSKNLFNDLKIIDYPNTIVSRSTAEIIRIDSTGEPSTATARLENLLVGTYPEGRIELPYVEVISNDKLSGNGELVRAKDSSIIGILNEFSTQNGRGKVIPSEIIFRFLNGSKEFVSKGFLYRPIIDETTSTYYGIPQGKHGIIVTDVFMGGSAYGILKHEDIILEVAGFPLDGKGRIDHPKYGKVSFVYLMNDPHNTKLSLGDKLPILVIRDRKKLSLNLIAKPYSEEAIFIPYSRDTKDKPSYLIVGGIVLMELSEFYLKEFGRAWRTNVDKKMLYLFDYHKYRTSDNSVNRPVFIMQVIPDEGNNGYHAINNKRVISLNNNPIQDLQDLNERTQLLLKENIDSKNPEWTLELEDGTIISLNRERIHEINKRIQGNYGISKLYSP